MADNNTRIIISAVDQASAVLGKVGNSIGSLASQSQALTGLMGGITAALSVGAIVSFAKGTIDAADNMNDLSQRVGVSIKDLAGWKLAADQSGTSLESVAKGVKGLSVYMVEHSDKLKAAGITATDANGAMIQLADLFAAMPDGVEKTALAVQLFGKAGMDMIPMLNGGSEGLAKAQEKAAAYARQMEILAPRADEFNDLIAEMKLNLSALAIEGLIPVLKPLTSMAQMMTQASTGADGLYKSLRQLQELTKSGPLSVFGLAANVVGATRGGPVGYGGPKDALGLPAAERVVTEDEFSAATDAYLKQRTAQQRARGLLDKSSTGAGKSKTAEEARLEQLLKLGQSNLAGTIDSEEEARILSEKRAMQEVRTEYEALQRILKVGEENQLAEYYATAGEETMRLVGEQRALKDAGKDTFAELTRAVEGWGNTFTDTLADMIMTGKASFGDLANSVIRDLLRMQIKSSITDRIFKDGGSFLSGFIGNLFKNADGGIYSSPDLHQYANTIVSSPTLFKFAQGGAFNGLMGEAGPEAIMPLRRGPDGRLGVQAQGSPVAPKLIINFTNQTGTDGNLKQKGPPRWDGEQFIADVVLERVASDPRFRAAFGVGQ